MDINVENRPRLGSERVASLLREHFGWEGRLIPLPAEWDQNFRLECRPDESFVVKIANRGMSDGILDFQNAALEHLARSRTILQFPRPVPDRTGRSIGTITGEDGATYRVRVLTWLEGQTLSKSESRDESIWEPLGRALGDLDNHLYGFTHNAMERNLPWDLRRCEWISSKTGAIPDRRRRGVVERMLLQFRSRVAPTLDDLPRSVIHNDTNDENILLSPSPDGGWKVTGLLDFGDMVFSQMVNEPAIACAYAMLGQNDPLGVAAALVAGYHRARPLSEAEMAVLFPLICMRLCVSVTTSAVSAREDPDNAHRQVSDRPAGEMLERLEGIDWGEADERIRAACGLGPVCTLDDPHPDLLRERRERIAPSYSLAYREPLEMVRGRGTWLFDASGRAYLDCVNNISHVGHCHRGVAKAIAGQAFLLNTNTRYLHRKLVEYARRLTGTLPEPLRICYFVNSGSEANELAIRIARAHTGREDVIVLDDAYHGNTTTLVDCSPYKCEGPGGRGLAPWAHKAVKPDPYRGSHRGAGPDAGRADARSVEEICARLQRDRRPPALFLCESILGCGGQVVLPDGYLDAAFRHVRAAGGLCAVDEVQVGFGRVGSQMWAFETQGVVPDIVTMGKPMGNGHPIGAVVTTPEIAASFANGMEFFSSFGGNPVSAAAGLAVLDAIEEEGLRERAARVGNYLMDGFRRLAERHRGIGDVRGLGMFLGVELVRDRGSREPAAEETARLIEFLKEDGILLSAEGPHHNVLKIKPPLAFLETDADLLLGAVDRALHEIFT